MKCIEIPKYGGPEVMVVGKRPVPQPKDNQVLIQIAATSINRPDIMQVLSNIIISIENWNVSSSKRSN